MSSQGAASIIRGLDIKIRVHSPDVFVQILWSISSTMVITTDDTQIGEWVVNALFVHPPPPDQVVLVMSLHQTFCAIHTNTHQLEYRRCPKAELMLL